jgi:hypothetical protein
MYVRMYLHINSLNLKTHTAGHARDRSSYVPVLPGTPTRTVRLASHSQRLIINNRSPCQQRFCYFTATHWSGWVSQVSGSIYAHKRFLTAFKWKVTVVRVKLRSPAQVRLRSDVCYDLRWGERICDLGSHGCTGPNAWPKLERAFDYWLYCAV